jgi:two-component system, NtrC family, sensor kinase
MKLIKRISSKMKQSFYLLLCLFLCPILKAQHTVTFILKEETPLTNDSVYISGTFNDWIKTPNPTYLMQPHGVREKTITLKVKAGKIEYKFHRGNWDKGETHNFGADVDNRQVNIQKDTTLIDNVKTWKDQVDSTVQTFQLSSYMLGKEHESSIITYMYPWYFKQGHDTAWVHKDLDFSNWQRLRPIELKASNADKNGRIEGWLKAKICLDSTFDSMPLYLSYAAWAAGELYLDGQLIQKYGHSGLDGQPFKEFCPVHKIPFKLDISLRDTHVLSFHFVDYVSPLSSKKFKEPIYFTLQGSKDIAKFIEHVNEEPVYITLWVVVSALLTVLFWLLAFQNPEEKNLRLIAITSSVLTLNCIAAGIPHSPIVPYFLFYIRAHLSSLTSAFIIVLEPYLIVKIFNRKVTTPLKVILSLLFIVAIYETFSDNDFLTKIDSYIGLLPLTICLYYIVSSRKTLKGAQWAIVVGLLFSWIWIVLITVSKSLDYRTFAIYQTGLYLSFPFGMLAYVAMRFKEIVHDVRENAKQVVQLSEEKNALLETQNETLEKQVKERTNELEKSLNVLKATQNQLVQSEKLASLGELTAGIAHEIQNPLNFVTNFSELSNELMDEMIEEMDKGNSEEVKAISNDLKSNLEKINHHGKRASSIVKGMLEHSRASTGVKELTDINKLADEYLRLSYHGLRAKDKNFNANMETTFDENLPKIAVIPQDLGRVLLNLFNNAFYAVNEKNKQNTEGVSYKPTVTISTQTIDNQIVIKVKDNGMGMSEATKAKVFQPFFTTKPTGQGTGLGLSLAYDIVTKGHGGAFEVVSTEGVGTEFILKLNLI